MIWGFFDEAGTFFDDGGFFDELESTEPPPPVPETAVGTAVRTVVGFLAPVVRFSVLAGPAGPVLATFEGDDQRIQSGTVTANRTQTARRSASLSLIDADGTLTPTDPGDLLFTGAWFRIERGAVIDGHPEYLSLATLVVGGFACDMLGRVVSITGQDPLSLLAGPFGDAVPIPDRTPAEDALRILWEPILGNGDDWPLDGGGRLMPLRAFLPADDRLDAVVRYFAAAGLEVYADRLGRPLMRPTSDATTAPAVAAVKDFRPGADATLLRLSRRGNQRVFNQVTVVSNAPSGPDLRVVLTVDDPASPVHPDRIGLRPAPPFVSAQIPDQAAANAIARQRLASYAFATDTVDGEAVPDITLDAGDVVTIDEPLSGTSGRYRIDTITLPVTTGSMSLTAGRIVPLIRDDA